MIILKLTTRSLRLFLYFISNCCIQFGIIITCFIDVWYVWQASVWISSGPKKLDHFYSRTFFQFEKNLQNFLKIILKNIQATEHAHIPINSPLQFTVEFCPIQLGISRQCCIFGSNFIPLIHMIVQFFVFNTHNCRVFIVIS